MQNIYIATLFCNVYLTIVNSNYLINVIARIVYDVVVLIVLFLLVVTVMLIVCGDDVCLCNLLQKVCREFVI